MTSTVPDPLEELLERDDRLTALKSALKTMSPQEQQVILRHQSAGRPLARVAAELGISRSEAREHLDSARRRLAARGETTGTAPRRDWTQIGERCLPTARRGELLRLIEKLTWHECTPTLRPPALQSLAIRAALAEFNLPNATAVAWDSVFMRAGESHGLYGIEANYPNGRARLYLLDLGNTAFPVLCDFWAASTPSTPGA
jgi:hypothetical protein